MERIGAPEYDGDDLAFAQALRSTYEAETDPPGIGAKYDERIALQADRVISIEDGQISGDKWQTGRQSRARETDWNREV